MLETKVDERPGASSPAKSGSVRALQPATRLSLRVRERELPGLGPIAGFSLDVPINRAAFAGPDLVALRLGPDEWLIIGAEPDDGALAAKISEALAGKVHAVTDVSHRSVGFAVEGAAALILNVGCPLDLDEAAFPVGAGTRTLLGKAEIVLLRTGTDSFRVECWRSFASYVHAFLAEAVSATLFGPVTGA